MFRWLVAVQVVQALVDAALQVEHEGAQSAHTYTHSQTR